MKHSINFLFNYSALSIYSVYYSIYFFRSNLSQLLSQHNKQSTINQPTIKKLIKQLTTTTTTATFNHHKQINCNNFKYKNYDLHIISTNQPTTVTIYIYNISIRIYSLISSRLIKPIIRIFWTFIAFTHKLIKLARTVSYHNVI